jgi:PAS domain S-box-containing protein
MTNEPKPKSFAGIAALIVLICIVVEACVMLSLHEFTTLSPITHAVIDVSIVSVTVLGFLYVWVLPALASSRRQASDQTRLLEALIDAMPVPVFYKNENGVYTGSNAAFERFFGLPKDKIVGQTVYGVAPEELARVYHKADMDLLAKGGRQVYESTVSHADGTEHDVVFHKAVYRKSSGEPGGIVGILLDVTD